VPVDGEWLDVRIGTGPVATGTDSVDAVFATGSAGDSVTVWATAYDARNTSRVATTYFLVEVKAKLTTVAIVSGQVLDYAAGRGLLVHRRLRQPDAVAVADRSALAEHQQPERGCGHQSGWLRRRVLRPAATARVRGELDPDVAGKGVERDPASLRTW
jgi:hypothetical protein